MAIAPASTRTSPQTFWAEVEPQTEWGSSGQVVKRRENFRGELATLSIVAADDRLGSGRRRRRYQ
jgi:hypothetical protein